MDSHFVKTSDLAKYVKEFVDVHGIEYLVLRMAGEKRVPSRLTTTSEYTIVTRILDCDYEFMELNTADRVLVAIDRTNLILHGDLALYRRTGKGRIGPRRFVRDTEAGRNLTDGTQAVQNATGQERAFI